MMVVIYKNIEKGRGRRLAFPCEERLILILDPFKRRGWRVTGRHPPRGEVNSDRPKFGFSIYTECQIWPVKIKCGQPGIPASYPHFVGLLPTIGPRLTCWMSILGSKGLSDRVLDLINIRQYVVFRGEEVSLDTNMIIDHHIIEVMDQIHHSRDILATVVEFEDNVPHVLNIV